MAIANDRAQEEFAELVAYEVFGTVVEYDAYMQESIIESNVSEREFIKAALYVAEDFVDDPDGYYDVRVVEERPGVFALALLV